MKAKRFSCIILALFPTIVLAGKMRSVTEDQPQTFITAVARDIESLKPRYPQLQNFSLEKHVDPKNLWIDYAFHTRQAQHKGGWTSGVPNPEPDGIWFYIDLHDSNSTAQIHTQPIIPDYGRIDGKIVWFLILEGAATKSIAQDIALIFKRHGAAGYTSNSELDLADIADAAQLKH